jgi:hypothetical protein
VAIYHCSTKPLARSSGRSAVAAAAYRSGDCLVDERQGIEHDYTRRRGVIHAELVLPEGAGAWTRAELWNAAEKAEKRKDARTAREWEVALPEELGYKERLDLALRFARGLASKYGCAVDVALHAPDREGDQRNWHAHLLATTRKVTAGALSEKCDIELSDAKRLSLSQAPARIEVEAVRQMWAQEVNRQLTTARLPERVDHRSLATQREEAIQKGESEEKVAELDRAPQVKLGWRVIQMERRGVASDRGNQLRQVQADNVQRKAAVIDIGQLRSQLAQRQQEEAARQRETEQNKLLEEVEAAFRGQSPTKREATLEHWRDLAGGEIPQVANARMLWEQDQWDSDAKAWRETRNTIGRENQRVVQIARDIEAWRRSHALQSFGLRVGLLQKPGDLGRLEQEYANSVRFLEGSQRRLEELEQAWFNNRGVYHQKLERQGDEIRKARKFLRVMEQNQDHFQRLWQREDRSFLRDLRDLESRRRSRDRDRGRGR